MSTGISISWHLSDDGHASFRSTSSVGGCVRLYEGDKDYFDPTIDIYMADATRAQLAAMAINGQFESMRQLLMNMEEEAAA